MRRVGLLAVGLAAMLAVAPIAIAQPKPRPTAAPSAAPSARPSASAAPAAGKSGGAAAGAPFAAPGAADAPADPGAQPPGHPQGDNLPPGHPPIDGQDDPGGDDGAPDDDEPMPAPSPRSPHGGGAHGGGDSGMFQPPEDTSQEDPTLPPGTIVVTIKDAKDQPIAGAPITLGIMHNSVAKGETHERLARDADGTGSFKFEGLDVGGGVAYRVTTVQGPATYALMPFSLSDKAGKRAVLHSYEAATTLDRVMMGMQAIVYTQLREDSIQVEQLLSVFNVGPVAWCPDDVTVALPPGFKAFNKQESMDDARVEEVKDVGFALRGTFGPGRHDLTFHYQVPLSGDAKQTLRLELPPHVAQARVMAESSKSMGLEVPDFPAAQRTQSREGKRLLVTERQVTREEGAMKTLEIAITGLPTKGPARWVAACLAALAIIAGVLFALNRKPEDGPDEDTRHDLADAREALLEELVALERSHKKGDIGPKTYARLRESLLGALARIIALLDAGGGDRAARRRRRQERAA